MARKPRIEEEEEDELHDDDDPAELGSGKQVLSDVKFIRMWPRAIFTTSSEGQGKRGKPPAIARTIRELESPGVYILYRDDQPFYVGQAKGKLRIRLRSHATNVGSIRSYFWNYFSAFLVHDKEKIDEIEAILIAAMPSALSNGAAPHLHRLPMGKATREVLRSIRSTGRY
jgi:hypothetical protein